MVTVLVLAGAALVVLILLLVCCWRSRSGGTQLFFFDLQVLDIHRFFLCSPHPHPVSRFTSPILTLQ